MAGSFWSKVFVTQCTEDVLGCGTNVAKLSNGVLSDLPTIQFSTFELPVFVEFDINPPDLNHPPQPYVGGPLAPALGSTPSQSTIPKCPAGFHPQPTANPAGPGDFSCERNVPPTPHITIRPVRPVRPIHER
jgi:hypothetical protein